MLAYKTWAVPRTSSERREVAMGYYFFGLAGLCLRIAQLIVSILGMRRRKKSTTFVLRIRVSVKTKIKTDNAKRSSRRKR